MRKSDKKWLKENVGFYSVVSKLYLNLCKVIKFISLTATLFLIPFEIGAVIRYSFIEFDPVKAVVFCVVLITTLYSNMKL